ncbi:hypothetical protein LL273_00595 [Marinobacter salarius]|jgi:hypothetical protein|nr:hypothetical protein [Marinobacter salarius]
MTARIVDCFGILSESAKDFLSPKAKDFLSHKVKDFLSHKVKDFAAHAENQFMNDRQPIGCLTDPPNRLSRKGPGK